MNRLPRETRILVLKCLVEGMNIRATSRLAGVNKNTVAKLLRDAGAVCAAHQNEALRGLWCNRVEVDEIWSFRLRQGQECPASQERAPGGGRDGPRVGGFRHRATDRGRRTAARSARAIQEACREIRNFKMTHYRTLPFVANIDKIRCCARGSVW